MEHSENAQERICSNGRIAQVDKEFRRKRSTFRMWFILSLEKTLLSNLAWIQNFVSFITLEVREWRQAGGDREKRRHACVLSRVWNLLSLSEDVPEDHPSIMKAGHGA